MFAPINVRSSGLVPDVRLPRTVAPSNYKVTLAPSLTEGTIMGEFEIKVLNGFLACWRERERKKERGGKSEMR